MKRRPSTDHSEAPDIPEHILLRQIGQGSYGDIWIARNTFGEFRAVKIIYRDRFEDDRPYERELNGIQQVEPITRKHAGLVDILQIGRTDDYFYYIMEIADDAGQPQINAENYRPKTLSTEISRRGRIPLEEVIRIGRKLSQALAFMHEKKLVHRDIKLSNVIYVEGNPKLADVGLVASANASFSLVGTYGYIPREGPGRPPADIYALGKVLYEIATGKDRADFPEIDILDPGLRGLNPIFLKACEELPEDRYTSAIAVDQALEKLDNGAILKSEGSRNRAPLKSWLIAFTALVAFVFLVIYKRSENSSSFNKNGANLPSAKPPSGKDPSGKDPSGKDPSGKDPEVKLSLNKGLLAHFPFDGNGNDVSGFEHHGRINGVTVTTDRTGKPGSAYSFAGGDDYVVIPDHPSLNLSGQFAISFWCTVEGGSPHGWMHLISKHRANPGGTVDGFGISIPEAADPLGSIHFAFGDAKLKSAASFYPFDSGKWYHVLVSSDGKTVSAYINNRLLSKVDFNGEITANNEPLTIGGQNAAFDGRTHVGKIDDVRIYSRALASGEIEALFKLKQLNK